MGLRCRGFTLLEMLVVLALIGLVLGVALARLGGAESRSAAAELARLRALVALASEQAVVRGDDLGIGFSSAGYRFFERARTAWRPLDEPRAYRAHRLPAGLALGLRMDAAAVVMTDTPARAPQVVLWSSGELTPFELTLGAGGRAERLIAAADGSLSTPADAGAPGR